MATIYRVVESPTSHYYVTPDGREHHSLKRAQLFAPDAELVIVTPAELDAIAEAQ